MSSDELANAETMPGSGDPAAVGTQLPSGTVLLDRYRIVRWLGAGGMGAVYAAHDQRLDQPVALKFVAGARSEVERDRLRAEVRTLQGLTHRGIARTFTFDEADGEPFIVMELLEGETLSARIARGRLDEPEARAVLGALATALDEAHRAGVVHRDVKPANVMLCPGGRVVLMDFGLARSDDAPAPSGESRSVLMTTSLKGTPAYLAPEMALGRRVDARADLYSLGVLAYEALTGKLPFSADSAKGMIDQHVARVPDDVRAKRPELSTVLSSLIARMLAKEPDDRPASAAEVLAALAPRRRTRWALVAAIAVLVVAALVVVAIVARRPHQSSPAISAEARLRTVAPEIRAKAGAEFDRAQAAHNGGRYDEAMAAWQRAYAIVPDPAILYNQGATAQAAKDFATAALLYRRYVELTPDVTRAERERVQRMIRGVEAEAARQADAGISPTEASARDLYDRAESYYDEGDFGSASELFMAAYNAKPDPAQLYNIAQAARRASRSTEAVFFYRQFLQAHPDAADDLKAQIAGFIADLERAVDAGP